MSYQKQDQYNDIYKGFFFTRVKQTVYKWWCVVYKPVYKLTHHGYWPPEKEPGYVPPKQNDTSVTPEQTTSQETSSAIPATQTATQDFSSPTPVTQTAAQQTSSVMSATQTATQETSSAEAAQIANQILQERQNNINQTISLHTDSSSAESVWDDSVDTSGMSEESVDLAKEIMARLAREAAEDEAKKQAQIEKAKREAEERARLEEIMRSNKIDINQYIEAGKASRPPEVDIGDEPD